MTESNNWPPSIISIGDRAAMQAEANTEMNRQLNMIDRESFAQVIKKEAMRAADMGMLIGFVIGCIVASAFWINYA